MHGQINMEVTTVVFITLKQDVTVSAIYTGFLCNRSRFFNSLLQKTDIKRYNLSQSMLAFLEESEKYLKSIQLTMGKALHKVKN